MAVLDKIINIIKVYTDYEDVESYFADNDDLTVLGMNSISFIKLVVAIEEEFHFEFEDEDLDYSRFTSLNLLCKYVESRIHSEHAKDDQTEADDEYINMKKEIIDLIIQSTNGKEILLQTTNNLLELELSEEEFKSVLMELNKRYKLLLEPELILSKNLFLISNLCNYVLVNKS